MKLTASILVADRPISTKQYNLNDLNFQEFKPYLPLLRDMREISLDLEALQFQHESFFLGVAGVFGFAARIPLFLTVISPDVYAHILLLPRRLLVQAAMLVPQTALILYQTAALMGMLGVWSRIEVHIEVMELLPSSRVQIGLLLDRFEAVLHALAGAAVLAVVLPSILFILLR